MRTGFRGRCAGLVLLALSPAALATAAEPVQRTVTVELLTAGGAAPASAPLVRVSSQGAPQPVLDVRALPADAVSPLLYLDLPLLDRQHLGPLLGELETRLDALLAAGLDGIAAAQASVVPLGEEAPTAAGLRAALATASGLAQVGELAERRGQLSRTLADASTSLEEKRRLVVAHYQAELELREWQQALLEDWLLAAASVDVDPAAAEARVVFLATGSRLGAPAEYARSLIDDHEVPLDGLTDERLEDRLDAQRRAFARATAALGITVHVLDAAALAGGADPSQPVDPLLVELAEASGGRVLADGAELDRAIEALGRRFAVTFQLLPTDAVTADQGAAGASVHGVEADPAVAPLDLAVGSDLRLRGPRWTHREPPRLLSLVRARRLLQDDEGGPLDVRAALVGEFAGAATLETVVGVEPLEDSGAAGAAAAAASLRGGASDRLRVTVVTQRLDRDPELRRLYGGGARLDRGLWALQSPIELPEDRDAIVVVAEDLASGLWGAALAEESDVGPVAELQSGEAVVEVASSGAPRSTARPVPDGEATAPPPPGAAAEAGSDWRLPRRGSGSTVDTPPLRAGKLLEILPPRGRPLTGKQTFKILLTNASVQRVVFELDGSEVGDDDNRPFQATVQLADTPREHTLRAIAYSGSGAVLGQDVLQINRASSRPGIELTTVQPLGTGGDVRVEAELRTPAGQSLDRVELYRNERLIATLTQPPFRSDLPGPARPDADFVRAVAWMRDGGFFEEVQLLGDASLSEEVDVNLVEVYTVASDPDGRPVGGLEAGDFEVFLGRERIEIERFARAEDVSLSLGVVIDTSESMYTLMDDTKRAASRFLSDTLKPIDRAFVVEFDDRPRLAHPTTSDVFALIRSLSSLQPSGMTALYDSILFANQQFEPGLGRKAIVLLTDGDDVNSKFSYRKTYQTASAGGLPIYFLSLAGFDQDRRSFRKSDLEALAKASGGRVFYVSSMAEVVDAYAQIADELRNQYVLAFSTTSPLSDDQLDDIRVRTGRARTDLRWVVGRE
ncbi:MAG: VWA domain-containing protein [Acidobacteria bacterium]|nr:MAG: VWA domain-containing protein [Acidobacteriota bacterium]REK10523.1 MAG: VWA domain-containing protein [Acidobacteriota bacterium]